MAYPEDSISQPAARNAYQNNNGFVEDAVTNAATRAQTPAPPRPQLGATGSWQGGGSGATGSWQSNAAGPVAQAQERYDPDAGAMVPDVGSEVASRVAGAAGRVMQSLGDWVWQNVGTGYAPPSGPMSDAVSKAAPPPVTTNISGSPRQANLGIADKQANDDRSGINTGQRGLVSSAAATPAAPVGIAKGNVVPQAMVGNAVSGGVNPIDQTNRSARAELNVMNAAENANADRSRALQLLQGQQAQATFEGRNKAQADYVDREREKNNMEWQLNSNPRALAAYKAAELQSRAGAGPAGNPVADALGAAQAGVLTNNNYVQQALAANDAGSKQLQTELGLKKGAQELQAGQQGLQQGEFSLKHSQLLNDLTAKMNGLTPGSPEHRQLWNSFRVLNGKDPIGPHVNVIQGATNPNPDNPAGTPLNTGGSIAISDPYTGETHVIPGTQVNPKAGATPTPADLAYLKAHPEAKALFESRFGPSATSRQ